MISFCVYVCILVNYHLKIMFLGFTERAGLYEEL